MLRPAWAFLGFLLGAAPAAAQPAFTPQGGMLFSSASVQEVAASTGAYHMFFVRDGFQILSATSTDLDVWKQQSGIRLSTSAVLTDPDRSSITSCGILPSTSPATGLQRLFYVGVSSGGLYSVLSATATDGRLFSKEPGIRLQLTGGTSFLNSPKPVALSSGSLRLYFVADSSGTNDPATYRVFSASSTDGGLTWRVEGKIIDDRAFEVSPAALSDGRLRLYYTSYAAGASTPTVLKSAISHDGVNFTQEARSSLSTSAPCGLWDIAVARSTDVYRWRLFASYTDALSSHTFISTAATVTPYPVSVSPSSVSPRTSRRSPYSRAARPSYGQASRAPATCRRQASPT
ncbi:MAG: sialidase family protein [Elusimicrobia bacterium]|nr:sialidase family protein [Elusimicrobiota bacterium]